MIRIFSIMLVCMGFISANQYDYLLYSHVLSDVQSGFELKADVNSRLQGRTPIYEAVKNNRLEITYLLIMAGADVNIPINGETPLHQAAKNKNPYITQLLVTAGAKINVTDEEYGNTPLHYAALNSDKQTLDILTSSGGDMTIKNYDGNTPAQITLTEITIQPIVIEDYNIAVSSSAFKIANSAVIFNVRNLTNEPLVIFHTGLYINGNLVASKQQPLTIPPGTTITNVNTMPIGINAIQRLKPDKNGQVDIKAGFNIEYQAEGRMQRAFNSIQTKYKLWNPPIKKQKEDNKEQ